MYLDERLGELTVGILQNFLDDYVNNSSIVVGHMADYIKSHIGMEWRGIPIKYYENKRYLETNNIVSLYKAMQKRFYLCTQ